MGVVANDRRTTLNKEVQTAQENLSQKTVIILTEGIMCQI